jgi:small subunit ribosomal protein S6
MNLRYYETLFIVHPNYEQERLQSVIDAVTDEIKKLGGEILNVTDWGKRRLAYPIDKMRIGTYMLIHFSSEPNIIKELTAWLRLQPALLSQLVVKLETAPEIGKKYITRDDDEAAVPQDFDPEDDDEAEPISFPEKETEETEPAADNN